MKERWRFALLLGGFALLYFVPIDTLVAGSWLEGGFSLLHEYARKHVLTCLVPAFFIAGAIAVYLNKDAVLRFLGPSARVWISYPIAALSGGVLAVCSCTVLPLFAGIHKRGAGLGPAIAFLFTGPAVNVTAIFLTVSVLGWHFAAFRLVAAIAIAVLAGAVMAVVFEKPAKGSAGLGAWMARTENEPSYSGGSVGLFLGSQVGLLVLLGFGQIPVAVKILVGIALLLGIVSMTFRFFGVEDRKAWMRETWVFTKQILPFLFVGVFLAGLLSAVLPPDVVSGLVGGNGLAANTIASLSGALMYFATLTEIPILQALLDLGMGPGPAMALLLTGNALSLPNLIVLQRLLGWGRTATYLGVTVSMSLLAGMLFGAVIA